MAKIVDLKQGTGNVFPRTIGEAVAVGGKLLTEAISNLDEKVSTVNDFISGEPAGTVSVAPSASDIYIGTSASDIYIGTDGNPNQRVRIIGGEMYAMSKHSIFLGTDTCNIEISPQMGIWIGDRYDNNRNIIKIGTSDNSIKIGHTYNSIRIGSDYSISIGTYNGIDINPYGKISIGAQLTNDVIIGTTYNNIKLGSDCSITIGTNEAIKIGSDGRVVFGPNSGFSGGGSGSNLDISSGTVMSIGAEVPTDIYIGTASLNNLKQIAKDIKIQNDNYSYISMSTSRGIIIENKKGIYLSSPEVFVGNGKHQIKLGSNNNLTIGYNDAIKINTEGKITFSENSGVPINTDNTVKLSKVTPSGDLQHYMYEQIGAIYNDTGSDIVRDAPWAHLVDDDNPDDKYVTHKAGYWYMNGLGDLSNDDMRNILVWGQYINGGSMQTASTSVKTVWYHQSNAIATSSAFSNCQYIKSIPYSFLQGDYAYFLNNCKSLKYIYNLYGINSTNNVFTNCTSLQYVGISSAVVNIDLQYSPLLSVKSILYMIEHAKTTFDFTITLHDDAYTRAIQNAEVLAALEAKPNITLASASGFENGTTTTSTTTPQS